MEFFENAPPKEIFENSILPIGLRLYNEGAYDISGGYLSVGLENDYMEMYDGSLKSIHERVNFRDPEHIQFDLKGKTVEHPEGEEEVITFTVNTKDLNVRDPQSETHMSLVSITSCYEYQTKAVETVCIDTDVYGFKGRIETSDGKGACEVKPLTLKSQGAPVAVTKIDGEMLPDKDDPSTIKPRFTITVKNLGIGQVVKKESIRAACSSDPVGYEEWNHINVKVYISTISEDNKLDCDVTNYKARDDGEIILKQKEESIRCSYEEGFEETRGVFSSPLYILLEYGYTDTISREVKIKKVTAT